MTPETEKIQLDVKNLVEFLKERAEKEGSSTFFVSHEELFEILSEPNKNRIRHSLRVPLTAMGINASYSARGDGGYNFTMPTTMNLHSVKKKTVKLDIPDIPSQKNTFSHFKTPYIAPPLFSDVKEAVARGRKVLLVGPPGCGKSRMFEQIASNAGKQVYRVALSALENPYELFFKDQIAFEEDNNGNKVPVTKSIDGVLLRCMKEGYFCILDEVDNCPAYFTEVLKAVCEDGGVVTVNTEKGPIAVEPHADFRLCFTANTTGHGDTTGNYRNAHELNAAFLDRIRPKIHMDYQYNIEKALVETMLPKHIVDTLYAYDERNPAQNGIVYLIRSTLKDSGIEAFLTLRAILGFAEDFCYLGWNKAMLYSIINDFEVEYQEQIKNIITSRLGKWAMPTNDSKYLQKYDQEIKEKGFGPTE